MAKKKLTVALTKDEQKDLISAERLYVEAQNARDEHDELEDKMQEAEDRSYELDDEAANLVFDLNDRINVRLRKEAEAEAAKLNKANKDPKAEYVVRYKGDAEIDVSENDAVNAEVLEVVKQKKHDPVAELRAVAKRLGYKIDKDVAEAVTKKAK